MIKTEQLSNDKYYIQIILCCICFKKSRGKNAEQTGQKEISTKYNDEIQSNFNFFLFTFLFKLASINIYYFCNLLEETTLNCTIA